MKLKRIGSKFAQGGIITLIFLLGIYAGGILSNGGEIDDGQKITIEKSRLTAIAIAMNKQEAALRQATQIIMNQQNAYDELAKRYQDSNIKMGCV